MKKSDHVRVRRGTLSLPTWIPSLPDKNPMFLEDRIYQGSSGKVYPLPFTDRVADRPISRPWQAVWLENRWLRVLVLPELGGRIHVAEDKTNGYDFIYRQHVIKPALVGLAGPWVSGGIEFNWPQHHRPSTFLPCDVQVEKGRDGSCTVWLSEHDPMARMKGMHGVCLYPDRAVMELKVRVYNRTPQTQSFLWWANVGVHVHEAYQSFFPPDVHYVADHAKRAMSGYPLCEGTYYGVDYGRRGRHGVPAEERPARFIPPHCGGQAPVDYAPNDLSWYANIPTPCSYMALGSKEDFLGGYDHLKKAGIIHVADHHIAPGKKQWTWGNHPFGYAWDRNLTETDGPYVELMAGVYTDNQPDFSFLGPGETRVWKQTWYPIRETGPAQKANEEAALHLSCQAGSARLGVAVSRPYPGAFIRLEQPNRRSAVWRVDLAPDRPFVREITLSRRPINPETLSLVVMNRDEREILRYTPSANVAGPAPLPATEPPDPRHVLSSDELYVTGLHLEQYRHVSRGPTLYWREAIRRDPGDSRCRTALGRWHLNRGEFEEAEANLRTAIDRLTLRNPNPAEGEAYYLLGLCLRHRMELMQGGEAKVLEREAYEALAKAAWNVAWASPAHHALAELDARAGRWTEALQQVDQALRLNQDHLGARNLKALILVQLGRDGEARRVLRETLRLDPLDAWSRQLKGGTFQADGQTALDVAHDYARAGFADRAIGLLEDWLRRNPAPNRGDLPTQSWGAQPMIFYTLGWLYERTGRHRHARQARHKAARACPDYCFPARLEEIAVLGSACQAEPKDARARYYLGNLFYDRQRHREAIRLWERSARLDPRQSITWRNLAIGLFNCLNQPELARAAYEKAIRANPKDARLIFERDQLWKRLGIPPARRLRELERHPELVTRRDDLSLELAALYNLTGQPGRALQLLNRRSFQPWEGGEGTVLGQYVQARLALGCQALRHGRAEIAFEHFLHALAPPDTLGEAKHLLANQSDVHYWMGCAYEALGLPKDARRHWRKAAQTRGDFQEMKLQAYSAMTFYSAMAMARLGQAAPARKLLRAMKTHARRLGRKKACPDYFATSRPAMLLFKEDLQTLQQTEALLLEGMAEGGLGRKAAARRAVAKVLQRQPSHQGAAIFSEHFL